MAKDAHAPKAPGQGNLAVGIMHDKVMIGTEERPIAALHPAQAAYFAAAIIRCCSILVSGFPPAEIEAEMKRLSGKKSEDLTEPADEPSGQNVAGQ